MHWKPKRSALVPVGQKRHSLVGLSSKNHFGGGRIQQGGLRRPFNLGTKGILTQSTWYKFSDVYKVAPIALGLTGFSGGFITGKCYGPVRSVIIEP